MPYITQPIRKSLDPLIAALIARLEHLDPGINVGDLNYVISRLCLATVSNECAHTYAGLNRIIGVLACVQQEFYRRVVADYEIQKCKENGDVFSTPKQD